MGKTKRARETEDNSITPPACKQTKLDDFFAPRDNLLFAVPTANKFDPLLENVTENQNQNGSQYEDVLTSKGDTLNTWTQSVGKEAMNPVVTTGIMDDLSFLTAKTVKCIFESLKHISVKVDELSQLLANYHKVDFGLCKEDACKQTSTMTNFPTEYKQVRNECGKRNMVKNSQQHWEGKSPSFQLKLQPNKVCLVICRYRGKYLSWQSKQLVLHHLSMLLGLKLSSIDLKQVEPLHSWNQTQRIMLTFESSRISLALLRQKSYLYTKGIFPARVFKNLAISSLLPQQFKHKNQKKAVRISKEVMVENQDLIKWDDPLPLQAQSKEDPVHFIPDNTIEENLLESFSGLPHEEQINITNRLEQLRSSLLSTVKNSQQLIKAESPGRIDATNCRLQSPHLMSPSIFPTKNKVQTDLSAMFTGENYHKEEKSLFKKTEINGMSRQVSASKNNGCIVFDEEGELNNIFYED